jgi:transcription elongation factor GreB
MSKAFTSEETPEAAPLLRRAPQLAPGEVRYVTPEGLATLQQELSRLRDERATAASLPDTERAARWADLDARAQLIDSTIAALTVLGPEAATPGKVAFATWVTVEDEGGRRTTWRLVGPDEADPKRRLLSVHAPVARALLGRSVGDSVEVERPGGPVELTIVAVGRTPP